MIRKFARYYKPHLKLFILDIFCAFLVSAINLVYPKVTGTVIRTKQLDFILIWSGALLGIFALKAVLHYIITYFGHAVGVRIQADMRRELFGHLQKLPFSYYDETKTGSVMSRLINDLFEVSELAHHGPEDVFLSFASLVGAVVMIGVIDYRLALINLAIIPLVLFLAAARRKDLMRASEKSRERTAEINAAVESAVSGIRVAKAYTAEEHENERFSVANKAYGKAKQMQYRAMAKFHMAMNFSMDFLYLVAFASGGLFFYHGFIDSGDLTTYVLYIAMMITPIRTFVNIFEQIQDGATGFKRFLEIMAIPPERESANPARAEKFDGHIVFDNVSFRYKKESGDEKSLILKNLDLDIPAGKTVALVGPSGGGKTTLCNLIPRFYEIDGGRITIDGTDTRDISLYDLRKNIGIVAQDVFIFTGTIKENIAHGNFDATDEEIEEAAKLANIHDFIVSLDKGYDTFTGERGVKLSGGQKQRIAIARAFLKNPPILILDEATSALDNVTEMQIQDALERLSEGRTTLVVAHRLSTVKNADEIIVIGTDGVEERGTHDELIKKDGIYATLYKYQFRI